MTKHEWYHFVLLPSRERLYLLIVDGRRTPYSILRRTIESPRSRLFGPNGLNERAPDKL
jgi:hypothetical protein